MTHDFENDFNFANSNAADAIVRRACHRLLIGCCGVARATPAEDRLGIDYWVSTGTSRFGLDLKLRRKDYGASRGGSIDCVIELDGYGSVGWLLKAGGADLILFACIDTNRIALFETKALRTAVLCNGPGWIASGRAREIKTESWRDGRSWMNRAIIVPADLLTAAIDSIDSDGYGDAANDGDAP